MKQSIVFIVIFFMGFSAQALELRNERNEVCGVEQRETKQHPLCGKIYNSRAEYPCPVNQYNRGTSASICGYTNGWCKRWSRCSVYSEGTCVEPAPDATCVEWHRVAATCRDEAFGVESYQTCEDPSFGFKEYKSCTRDHPDFKPILYYQCEFYKTPGELDTYLTEVESVMEVYALDIADAMSDLYAKVSNERAFWCMIDKYKDDPFYDEVVIDLQDTFFLEFGIDYTEISYDCSVPIGPITITLAGIDCDDLSIDELTNMTQPPETTRGQFVRFRSQCRSKKSYEAKEAWFVLKEYELGLLVDDIVARQNPEVKGEIESVIDFMAGR